MRRRGFLVLALAASLALAAGPFAPEAEAKTPQKKSKSAPAKPAPTPAEAIHNLGFAQSEEDVAHIRLGEAEIVDGLGRRRGGLCRSALGL